jgi:hypothetical protein
MILFHWLHQGHQFIIAIYQLMLTMVYQQQLMDDHELILEILLLKELELEFEYSFHSHLTNILQHIMLLED